VFPTVFKIEGDGGVVSEGGESAFCGVVNALVFVARSAKLKNFVG
jgi:hypothetical protein